LSKRKEEMYINKRRIHNIYQNIKKIACICTDRYVFIKLTHTHKKTTNSHSHTYQTVNTIKYLAYKKVYIMDSMKKRDTTH